eukprot:283424_1
MNLYVDNNNQIECDPQNYDKNPIQSCLALKRIIYALTYYDKLNIQQNKKHCQLFNEFTNETYHQLINDYVHLHTHHSHQLDDINQQLQECDMSMCKYTRRHYSQTSTRTTATEESALNSTMTFYKQIMDSMHFYLHHCFHVGLRVKKPDKTDEKQQDDEIKTDDKYFDAAFSRMNKMILQRKDVTEAFDRFSTKNNKFNIKSTDEEIEYDIDGNTNLDEFYKHLQNKNIKQSDIKHLSWFIQCEEYDTDCIEYDMEIKYSNIATSIKPNKCIETLKQFVKATKIPSLAFSVGLRFYYWDDYQQLIQLP